MSNSIYHEGTEGHQPNSKSCLAVVFMLLVWLLSPGCVSFKSGHSSGPPPSNTGDLTVTYIFELVGAGIDKSHIVVDFSGHLKSPAGGSEGLETFSQTVKEDKMPTRLSFGPGCEVTQIGFTKNGLKPGTWSITGSSGFIARKVTCEVEVKAGGTNFAPLNTCNCNDTPQTCCTSTPPQRSQIASRRLTVDTSSTVMLSDNIDQKMLQVNEGSIEIVRDNVLNNLELSLGDVTIGSFATSNIVLTDVRIRNLAVGFADFQRGQVSVIPAGSIPFDLSFDFNGQRIHRTIVPLDISTISGNNSLQLATHFDVLPDLTDPLASSLGGLSQFIPSTIDINILASEDPQAGSECVRSKPTVVIDPAVQSASAGKELAYTVTVTNNDSATCPASTFTGMGDFPEADFNHTPARFRITLRPGESGKRKIRITPSGKTCVGSKRFRETVTNESVPGLVGSATAVFEVLPIMADCGRAIPTIDITPASQEAPPGEELTYRVIVTNNDNPACGPSTFMVTPTLPAGIISHSPARFVTLAFPGHSGFRDVKVRSNLLATKDIVFTETATHTCATCLLGSGSATLELSKPFIIGIDVCCSIETADTGGTFLSGCAKDTGGPCSVRKVCTSFPQGDGPFSFYASLHGCEDPPKPKPKP